MKLPPTDKQLDMAKLDKLLQDLDITNEEAANTCGVAIQTVYRWLNGTSPIPKAVLRLFELMLIVSSTQNMIRVHWHEVPGHGLTQEERDELAQG